MAAEVATTAISASATKLTVAFCLSASLGNFGSAQQAKWTGRHSEPNSEQEQEQKPQSTRTPSQ